MCACMFMGGGVDAQMCASPEVNSVILREHLVWRLISHYPEAHC